MFLKSLPKNPELRFFILIISTVILAEAAIMILFLYVRPSQWLEVCLDPILLAALISPVLYFFSYRPLIRMHRRLNEAENTLRENNAALERRIAERTSKWMDTDRELKIRMSALEAASNGILITDKAGHIIWVNSAFSRMTGYSFAESIGKNPRMLKSGEHSPQTYKEMWDTILSGNSWVGEIVNRRKDGSQYFEKMTITPVKSAEGLITHFIAVKEDISADKKLEAQFRQAQKMEAVGRLAGGVAHDFNNLLTIILGHSELLLADLSPDHPSNISLKEIKLAATRAASLTRQLLAFSRKQVLQSKVVDLNEVVLGADKMIRRLLGEDIEFVTLFGQNLAPIKVDPSQIEQVIMNLAVNARDAMPKGGKLVVETSSVSFDAKEASRYAGLVAGNYVMLKVQDTGCGMSAEVKSHLFEPFFTTKEKGKGTGLGLATIYGIVKQSKGFIYAESELGSGAAFMILLPPSDEKIVPAEIGGRSAAPHLPVGTETILIAEDEDLVRSLAVQVLTRQGFHILEARNGIEALDSIQQHKGQPVQLLITDVVMPHMGGIELAEKFSAKHPGVKIIFTSGYTDHGSVQNWLDKGCRFLQKPYTYSELLLAAREVLDGK